MENLSKEIVEVHNLDSKAYLENYKEEDIYIPAHSFVKMKRRKAVAFLARYPKNNDDGTMKAKRLSIRRPGESFEAELMPELAGEELVCHLDGKVFNTQIELDNHLKKFESKVTKSTTLIKCPLCDRELDNQNLFMEHLKQHKEKESSKAPTTQKPVKFGKKDTK